MRVLVVLPLIVVFMFLPVAASHGADDAATPVSWPDYADSYCTEVTGGFYMTPEGDGESLIDQGMAIELWVVDVNVGALENFPREDLWFQAVPQQDLRFCDGGNLADANTDAAGHAVFSLAPRGGGHSEMGLAVYIAGFQIEVREPYSGQRRLDVRVNSPDINADGMVNLSDITLFTHDLTWGYDYRSDFSQDGNLDLHDIVVFANSLGESCQ